MAMSSKPPILRICLAAFVIVLLSLLIVVLVVTGYAFSLAFQARGAPDQARIGQFGQWIGSWLTPVLQIILTAVGARWIKRKSVTARSQSGAVLGVLVVILAILSYLLFGWSFQTVDVLWCVLIIVAGWLGGRL